MKNRLFQWIGHGDDGAEPVNNSGLKPYLRDGSLNPRYAEAFAKNFFFKWHFPEDRTKDIPEFPLIGKHNDRKFIVFGNGPSLKKFDFSLIRDAVSIGTNTTSEFYHANYIFISSPYALLRAQPFIDLEKSVLLIQAGLWNARSYREIWAEYSHRVIPVYTDGNRDWDITRGKIIGTGPVVGLTAIDSAILMGARSILVVGCDGYKGKNLKEMYAGNYDRVYRRALASRQRINQYERMLWSREEEVHQKYVLRQEYCLRNGIDFAVWGEDNTYDRLNRIREDALKQWC